VLAASGPIFLEFKHSFIREPGHVDMLFLFMPLVAAIYFLFVSATGPVRSASIGIAIAFAAVLIYAQRSALLSAGTGLQYARPLGKLFRWAELRRTLAEASAANLARSKLPPELLARIGGRTVAIFPWEVSYAAANELDYRPFPVFQSYDAYTPFLDGWNAEFFENTAAAPEFVVFDWTAIDGRHPLLDVPQTALALYRHYVLDGTFGNHLLLRRLNAPRFQNVFRNIRQGTVGVGEPLHLSTGGGASVIHLHLRWNLEGALKKFFWRLPEIRWIGTFGDGSTLAARIPPAVLAGGAAVDLIPADSGRMRELYSGEPGRLVESVVIGGQGAKFVETPIRYQLSAIGGVNTRPVLPAEVPMVGGLRGDCKVDFVDDSPVDGRSVTVRKRNWYVKIRGWALSTPDVVVRIDGHTRRAAMGIERPDIVAAYRQPAQSRPGFELVIPSAGLSTGPHAVEVFARNIAGGYQSCGTPVTLQVD
jgi:hypothetical protein